MLKSLATYISIMLATGCSARTPFEQSWPLAADPIGQQLAAPSCSPAEIAPGERRPLTSALQGVVTPSLSDETGLTPLDYAVIADDVPSIGRFMELGYSLSSRDIHQSTPLHVAVLNGSKNSLAFLLDNGADPNAGNNIGATPLMVAAEWNRLDAAKSLIAAGASPKASTTDGLTALHYAIPCKNQAFIDLLIAEGVDPDVKALEMAGNFNVRLQGHGR